MKKSLILLVTLISIAGHAPAQWQQTNGPDCDFVYSIKSKDNYLFASSKQGIFRSSDGDDNWTLVNNGLKDTFVFSLEVSGNMVVAGTKKKGIFISTDYGDSWMEANNGLTTNRSVLTLLDESGTIYAGLNFGLFVTHDYGTIWGSLGLPMLDIISVKKKDSLIIAAGHAFYLSEDNGITWDIKTNGLPNDGFADIAIIDSTILALTANWGLYKSNDFGESWESDSTFNINTISTCNKILVYGSHIFIGTFFHGIYYSSNQGTSWTNVSDGFPN